MLPAVVLVMMVIVVVIVVVMLVGVVVVMLVVAEPLVFWLDLVPALVLVVRVNLQVSHTPLVR